jgi:hypothetical protein
MSNGDAGGKKPFEKVLSENVVVLYGYRDGHAVVKVRLPIPGKPWYSVEIPVEAIVKFKSNFEDAYDYGRKPEGERNLKSPVEFEAREDCRGRWGYQDAHVELSVKRLIWFTISFPFEEFVLAKRAMDEAHAWASMPEDVRILNGI